MRCAKAAIPIALGNRARLNTALPLLCAPRKNRSPCWYDENAKLIWLRIIQAVRPAETSTGDLRARAPAFSARSVAAVAVIAHPTRCRCLTLRQVVVPDHRC